MRGLSSHAHSSVGGKTLLHLPSYTLLVPYPGDASHPGTVVVSHVEVARGEVGGEDELGCWDRNKAALDGCTNGVEVEDVEEFALFEVAREVVEDDHWFAVVAIEPALLCIASHKRRLIWGQLGRKIEGDAALSAARISMKVPNRRSIAHLRFVGSGMKGSKACMVLDVRRTVLHSNLVEAVAVGDGARYFFEIRALALLLEAASFDRRELRVSSVGLGAVGLVLFTGASCRLHMCRCALDRLLDLGEALLVGELDVPLDVLAVRRWGDLELVDEVRCMQGHVVLFELRVPQSWVLDDGEAPVVVSSSAGCSHATRARSRSRPLLTNHWLVVA